jgi:hypothetical protein
MMVYSYLLLVAPVLFLLDRVLRSVRARAILVTLVVVQGVGLCLQVMTPLRLTTAPHPVSVVLMNLSFFVALGIWVALIRGSGPRTGDARGSGKRRAEKRRALAGARAAVRPATSG